MRTFDKIDLPGRLAPVLPLWAGELITALICLAATGVTRVAMDAALPGAAPFVLLYPACLAATLMGGWRAGVITLTLSELAAWAYLIPPRGLSFKGEAQPATLAAVLLAGLLVVGVAQLFRTIARQAAAEGSAKIAERELMLRELEHRTSNNFQSVAAMIGLQLRRSRDEPARKALSEALGRVTSLSDAHRNLSVSAAASRPVDMDVYLSDLCASLAQALFLGEVVRLECDVEHAELQRDRAVALGLIVNELVTNAAKHAFADGAG
ncbi:MAG TPA: sensor histidine kinase, partial [Caulobacteraceae bacterium]|nr:sensor histidine kinase [Caulobacteraceae bacterium]